MGKPIALRGHYHACPKVDPGPKPHIGGPISQTQDLVTVNGVPVAVKGDICICVGDGNDPISQGSTLVTIMGKPVARTGDATEHGGRVIGGDSLVILD